ncbi:MAG: outer membrane beta-barrel protein [Candidatus Thiodiazotropha sp.]
MKRYLKHILLLSAAGLFIPTIALSQWYIGAEVGQTDTELDVGPDFPADFVSTDDDTAYKVFAGYNVSSNFAAEFGYGDLGEYNINDLGSQVDLEFTAWYATLIGRVQIADRWKMFGRLGYAYWDTDLSYTEPGFSSSGSDTGFDPVLGLGFLYSPTDMLDIRFEWEQFQNVGDEVATSLGTGLGNIELNGHDVNVVGIGVTYRFNLSH